MFDLHHIDNFVEAFNCYLWLMGYLLTLPLRCLLGWPPVEPVCPS